MNKTILTKRIAVFLIIFTLLFTTTPWQDISSYAFDAEKYYVDNITITKIYSDGEYGVTQTKVTIRGRYLQSVPVGTMTSTGYKVLKNPNPNMETVQEFLVDGDIVGDTIDVGNVTIPIVQKELPTLNSIDKRSVSIGSQGIQLRGSYLSKIKDDPTDPEEPTDTEDPDYSEVKYSAYYENQSGAGGQIELKEDNFTTNEVDIPAAELHGVAGLQNIILKKEKVEKINFENESGERSVSITIQNTYEKQFRLIDTITVEGLVMNPNRGQPGDEIIFESNDGLDNYDVFFLKNLTDKFSNDSKGRNTSFTPDINNRQVLTTQVPPFKLGAIENGEYYVVLTNKIPSGKDPNNEVNKQLVLSEKFTVIDSESKIQIYSVEKNTGPDTGKRVDINGVFFGSLNIPEFVPDNNTPNANVTVKDNGNTMEVSYGKGTYKKDLVVNSAKRTIRVIIGSLAKFPSTPINPEDYSFTDGLDKMSVITPTITDAETNPVKDVVVETETILDIEGQTNNIIIKDRGVLENGYTFIPSKVTPRINDIAPAKIQVNQVTTTQYNIKDDRMIAIHGENFLVHKYEDNMGNEVLRYPIIELGKEIVLNKNNGTNDRNPNPDLYLKVFNDKGEEVDGSEGNEIGEKILVIIPKNTTVEEIGKTYVKVINPVRNADTEGLSHQKYDAVELVHIVDSPVIESVEPNIVTVEGNQEIVVTGNNFQEGVEIYLDGILIPKDRVTREGNLQGNKMLLKFNAPAGREGTTQLQVMNPDGGIDVAIFTYVKTMNQDPLITNFSPQMGSNGTLVVVNGDNFVKPDPTTPEILGMGIYRLIGSRIILGDTEVNTYNKEGNIIKLKDYVAPVSVDETNPVEKYKLLYSENETVKVADYYQSVILQDDTTNKFYTINVDGKGVITLTDGVSTYTVTKPSQNANTFEAGDYTITYVPGEVSKPDSLHISGNAVDAKLNIMTPYATEIKTQDEVTGSFIIGHRVKIVNKNQLYFTVPQLEIEGWYDLIVVNPDTKNDKRVGTEGFYYSKHPLKKPTITEIIPFQGSVDGGYPVEIIGTNFEENSITKAKVIVGGVEVPQEDIFISTDKTKITFKAPPYTGDLATEVGTDRKTVPVVVVNPDGGPASKEDGFTYIIPSSKPTITKLSPEKGNASGGIPIYIEGWGFRYTEPYEDDNGNFQYDDGEKYTDINNDGEWTRLEEGTVDSLSEADKEILPKIYFGNNLAEIIEFNGSYLYVNLPTGIKGVVDVYVVNNDHGISDSLKFTYEATNPQVSSIEPKIGKKQGKDKIEINGSDFSTTQVEIYKQDKDDGSTEYITQEMSVVRFGDPIDPKISNREISLEEINGGRIIGSVAKVTVGNLTVDYNGTAAKRTLTLTVKQGDKSYKKIIKNYDDTVKYIDLNTLMDGEEKYSVFEMVKVSVDNQSKKLMVERGYIPHHEKNEYKETQLTIYTPTHYAIGRVPVTVINPDGGEGKTEYEYKNPESAPRITNITKEGRLPLEQDGERILELTYKGGNIVSILGDDFRKNATIQISDVVEINANNIEYDSIPTKLTFTMPAVPESALDKKHRVMIINDDGGVTSSDESLPTPIYIKFIKGETEPAIESIEPDKGPASGGTKVIIHGKGFREEIESKKLSVFFGDVQVPEGDVEVIDYQTIVVYAPAQAPGTVSVKVENPDGEISNPKGEFTYLSTPKIISVVDSNDPNENTRISNISVEGGQTIKLKGSNFMEGARVLFTPILTILKEGKTPQGELVYVEGQPYDLQEGIEGTEVTYIDGETLTVKTPQGKLDSIGMVVVNPDGGASYIYEDLKYGLPEISAPGEISAELLYDRYIKVNWTEVVNAKDYQVYVVVDNRNRELIGSTDLNSFVYKNLQPNTRYRFIVKAVGDFGGSEPSKESNTVETGRRVGPPDNDGELGEEYSEERLGDLANVIIGTDAFDGKDITIDLTRGTLAGSKELTLRIPAKVIGDSSARNIRIIGSDISIKLHPNAFYTDKVRDNRNSKDAGVIFQLKSDDRVQASQGQTLLSKGYTLQASMYIGKNSTKLDYLRSSIQVTMDVDRIKAGMRNQKTIFLGRYDDYEETWLNIAGGNSQSFAITGLTQNLGNFAIIGNRR